MEDSSNMIQSLRFLASFAALGFIATGLSIPAQAAAVTPAPYTVDQHTLHLYHFNSDANDAVRTNPMDLVLYGAAIVTTDSLNATYGQALATLRRVGSSENTTSAAMHPASWEDVPFSSFTGNDGAFTFEAYVRSDCPLASQNGQVFTGENEGSLPAARAFQFRMISSALVFTQVSPAVVTNTFTLPTTGTHAYEEGKWFHAAVTYTGVPNTPDNLKVYWTRLDAFEGQAVLLGSTTMVESIPPTTTVDFTIGNSSRASTIHPGGVNAFLGVIDEVRISKIAREPNDMMVAPAGVSSSRRWQTYQ